MQYCTFCSASPFELEYVLETAYPPLQQCLLHNKASSGATAEHAQQHPATNPSSPQVLPLHIQNEPAYFNELLPIPNILSGIRAHYWESPLPDSLKQAQAGSLTLHELREVRRGLLEVVGVFLRAAATQQNALSSNDIQVSSSRCC